MSLRKPTVSSSLSLPSRAHGLLIGACVTGALVSACQVEYRTPTISTWSGSSVPAPVPPQNANVVASPRPTTGTGTQPVAAAPRPASTISPNTPIANTSPGTTPTTTPTATPVPTTAPTTTTPAATNVAVIKGSATFGNDQAVPGSLRGIVYAIPEGTTQLPDFSKLAALGYFYTTSLNVPSRSFDDGFPGISTKTDWFAIRYEGWFVVSNADTFKFTLASDDGSALYIDDKLVISNDGAHTIRSAVADVPLTAATHSIRVDYWQGAKGPVALQLYLTTPKLSQRPWSASL